MYFFYSTKHWTKESNRCWLTIFESFCSPPISPAERFIFLCGKIHLAAREIFVLAWKSPCLYFCDLNFIQNIHSFTKPVFSPKPAKREKNCVKKHPNFFPETFPKGPFFIGTGAISNLSAANFRHPAANRQEDGRSRHGDGRCCDYDRPNQ